jgi:hypothetical protein
MPLSSRAARIRALLTELLVVIGAPALLMLVRAFSWGAGTYRFFTLCSLTLFVALASSRRTKIASLFDQGRARDVLLACVLALFGVQAGAFVLDIVRGDPCVTDMGRPSICAGEWLIRHKNPWAECWTSKVAEPEKGQEPTTFQWCVRANLCIDRKVGPSYRNFNHHAPGFEFMDGYKYGPLMALSYLPATHVLGERGLYLTNFVFWLGMLALVFRIARAAYPTPASGLRALFGFLVTVAIPLGLIPQLSFMSLGTLRHITPPSPLEFVRELTTTCSNDVIPIALLLATIALAASRRSVAAGVLIGLSMAAKQLPAPLIGLLLLRMDGVAWRKLLAAAVVTTTLAYLPFFAWAPREMVANLLLFNFVRPTNSSSIRRYLPEGFEVLVSLAQLATVGLCILHFYRKKQRSLGELLPVATVLILSFVTLNKIVHGNYLVWAQPFIALTLSGAPFRVRVDES